MMKIEVSVLKQLKGLIPLFLLLVSVSANSPSFAFAPEPDLLKIKGYSPEVIHTTEVQRSRQEWRVPPVPRLSPMERFLHNIYYNDWVGSLDEFGSQIIRYRQ
ncbi:MAG: hypothetical protein K2X66_04025 [Cyanobacteria bacterium]|jgi:hypothetical protein|nr:hypothetical protein [Cyanobacteriota bacterium]